MKILFVQKVGGVAGSEKYLLTLLPRLCERGLDAHLLIVQPPKEATRNTSFVEALRAQNVPVHVFDSPLPISLGLIRRIHKLIQAGGYDLIQTNLIHADVWLALIKAWFDPGLTVISVKHGYDEAYQVRHGLDPAHLRLDRFAILTRWAAKYADAVVSVSSGLQDFLVAGKLADGARCEVVPHGFSFDAEPSVAAKGTFRYSDRQILVTGRLVPFKQPRLALEILPGLVRRHPDVKLVFVGSGPLELELQQAASDLGIADHIVWAGFRPNVHDYMRDSDFLLLLSTSEGFGVVMLEAWSNGKPIVAFDVPAPNEVITDGADGFLVPPFDGKILTDRCSQLLGDPALSARMGERGYQRYRTDYSVDTMVGRMVDIYARLYRARTAGRADAKPL